MGTLHKEDGQSFRIRMELSGNLGSIVLLLFALFLLLTQTICCQIAIFLIHFMIILNGTLANGTLKSLIQAFLKLFIKSNLTATVH